MKIPSLRPYLWVGYPLAVVVLIILTLGSRQTFDSLLQKKQQTSEKQQTLGRLKTKLALLKQVNMAQTSQDLGWMLQVMPKQKQFDTLVNELRFGAQSAGAALVSYKGGSGAEPTDLSLTVEFLVPDFNSYQKLVATLENTLPLLSITKVELEGPGVKMDISSAWAPLTPASVKIDEALPDYAAGLSKIKRDLAAFQVPVVVVAPESSTSATPLYSTEPFGPLPASN